MLVGLLGTREACLAASYECNFNVTLSKIPARAGHPPAWTDTRYKTLVGRKAIMREASILAFKKLQRCRDDGTESALPTELPECTNKSGECDIDITAFQSQGWKNSYFSLDVGARYEPIQKQPNTGARISPRITDTDEGWWVTPAGFAPQPFQIDASEVAKYQADNNNFSVEHKMTTRVDAEIEVFPAVFERHQLWIDSESRWARSPASSTSRLSRAPLPSR